MKTLKLTRDQRLEILNQIGRMNVLAISGGMAHQLPDGIELRVSCGYRVRVRLLADDTYRVERVLVRGEKTFGKGSVDDVYCDQVGQMAYYASCFRNDSAHNGEWHYGREVAV